MSVIWVTRHSLQRHSSGIHLVIVGIIIIVFVIVHVSVGRVVVVSVKVVGRCELVGHSPRNPLGPSSPLARPFVATLTPPLQFLSPSLIALRQLADLCMTILIWLLVILSFL